MITFNPSFCAIPKPKTFSRVAKYKNNDSVMQINIKSEAPRSYDLNIMSMDKDGKPVSGYREAFSNGSIQEFREWVNCALNKVRTYCADSKVSEDMQNFFSEISK